MMNQQLLGKKMKQSSKQWNGIMIKQCGGTKRWSND
jgi:hypothetical protein